MAGLLITVNEKDGTFSITGSFEPPRKSSTGKTMVIATGRQQVAYKGQVITLAVNGYQKI